GGWLSQAEEQAERRALARTVGPEEAGHGSPPEREADALDCDHLPVALAEPAALHDRRLRRDLPGPLLSHPGLRVHTGRSFRPVCPGACAAGRIRCTPAGVRESRE